MSATLKKRSNNLHSLSVGVNRRKQNVTFFFSACLTLVVKWTISRPGATAIHIPVRVSSNGLEPSI